MEHRWGTRYPLSAPAILSATARDAGVARVIEASTSGAFIETRLKPPVLGRITLRLASTNRTTIYLQACVVRQEERGVAVEWLDPDSDLVNMLLSLADPARIPAPVLQRERAVSSAAPPL
jgi:hypothetical protein